MNDDFSPFGDAFQNFRHPEMRTVPCSRCGKPTEVYSTLGLKVCTACMMNDMLDEAFKSGAGYTSASTTGTTSKPSFEEVLRASARRKQAEFEREKLKREHQTTPPPVTPTLNPDAEMLRRLIQLCHPDKHANSEASQKATRWLLDLKAKGR